MYCLSGPSIKDNQMQEATALMNVSFSLEDRFDALCNPALWRALAPSLHVSEGDLAAPITPIPFEPDHLARVDAAVQREGYFQTPPLDWNLDVAAMAEAITALVAA